MLSHGSPDIALNGEKFGAPVVQERHRKAVAGHNQTASPLSQEPARKYFKRHFRTDRLAVECPTTPDPQNYSPYVREDDLKVATSATTVQVLDVPTYEGLA